MSTLLIDIGNSRTKWRVVDLDQGFQAGDPAGATVHTEGSALACDWRDLSFVSSWVVNVAGADRLQTVLHALAQTHPGRPVDLYHARATELTIRNGYEHPEALGADRWAGMVGARALYPEDNLLVVSLGTATTIDFVQSDGLFTGGVILPGLALMRDALAHKTAALPLADGNYRALAQNTDDGITSGILHAQAGAIERVVRLSGLRPRSIPATRHGASEELVCVLTGGHAMTLQPLLPFPAVIADNLVLRGLFEVARHTVSGTM